HKTSASHERHANPAHHAGYAHHASPEPHVSYVHHANPAHHGILARYPNLCHPSSHETYAAPCYITSSIYTIVKTKIQTTSRKCQYKLTMVTLRRVTELIP